jgi:alpha-N-arabinofuranosidase
MQNIHRSFESVAWRALPLLTILCLAPPVSSSAQDASTPVRATIQVDASQVTGHVDPLLYGQFLEYMFQCIKGGLHGELIRNRSFEEPANVLGLSRYWEPYPDNRNDDYAMHFTWDDATSYPERNEFERATHERSLRVDVQRGVITRHGVCQGGMPVRQGVQYDGYVWLKTSGYEGRIAVALESEIEGLAPYDEAKLENVRGGWSQYRFRLRPRASDPLARFVILFAGRGRVWVDQVSLLPADAVDGVRQDVFERVRDVKPAFIRWPGGNVAQDYHWLWGIGPRDERVTWVNLSWRNEQEPSDLGTDEYVRFCRRAGAEPAIVVNVEGRGASAEEAAAWVEYCNGPASSKQGAVRAANGQREPYGVKYWELGNEIWGSWVRGHSDAERYAKSAVRYAQAMRAVDPSIKLIACGDNNMDWNRTVLREAGSGIDYLAIHHYYGTSEMRGDPLNLMARPLHYEAFYRSVGGLIKELCPGRPIKLAINEWGLSFPIEQEYSIESALFAARLMNVFERSGDLVAMSSVSDLVNGWPGGIIQAGRHGHFVTPTYLVNKIYAEHLGRDRVATEVTSPVFNSSHEGRQVPYLDAVATLSADGCRIFIKAVNTDREHALFTTVRLKGKTASSPARLLRVLGRVPGAFNSFSSPDAIQVESSEIEIGETMTLELPPASVCVLTLRTAGAL